MKIKELKDLIEGMDEDAEFYVHMQDGCCGDTLEMSVIDLDQYSSKFALIVVGPVPGYQSCRQSANTKNSSREYWEKVMPKHD